MDDSVIAGLPANTGPTSLAKKPVAKVAAQTAAKEKPAAKADAKKGDAKAEPKADAKKADDKAEPKTEAKAEAKKDAKDTMPPKVTVSMDDAVIAGLPAHAGQDAFNKKKPAVPVKAVA